MLVYDLIQQASRHPHDAIVGGAEFITIGGGTRHAFEHDTVRGCTVHALLRLLVNMAPTVALDDPMMLLIFRAGEQPGNPAFRPGRPAPDPNGPRRRRADFG